MKKLLLYLALFFLLAIVFCTNLKNGKFDYVIKNGKIVDGTGNPWYRADIGIKGEKIAKIGFIPKEMGKILIDASDKIISPGFIDIHTHTDDIIKYPSAHNYIMQGVTTVISGNCGGSELGLHDFFKTIDKQKMALNYGTFVGQGSIRDSIMGNENRKPTEEEMQKMKVIIENAMKEGAIGLSTGLEYTPGAYSDTEEVIELAKVITKYNGLYVSHIRNEGEKLIESIEEAVKIGEKANIPVHISHFKSFGVNNWGKSGHAINIIEEARKRGIDITDDQYPYPAASTGIGLVLPTWVQEGENWREKLKDPEFRKKVKKEVINNIVNLYCGNDFNRIQIATYPDDSTYEGKGLTDILKLKGEKITPENAAELVIDLSLVKETDVVYHAMSEEDVELIMKSPTTMRSSDGHITEMNVSVPHPRCYGAFPRVLGVYVREKGILTLEEAIKKMTSMPANRLQIRNRGLISTGKYADIVIFDSDKIIDKATFEKPHQYPEGIEYVFVNGKVVVEGGRMTGILPGKIIYGPAKIN